MSFYNAKRQFQENLNLFSNPKTEPEKFNLYAGLQNLVIGLENLEDEINQMKNRIASIERCVR